LSVNGDSAISAMDVFNFPNPFDLQTKTKTLTHGGTTSTLTTDGTIIRYVIPAANAGAATIDIYDVVGEKVRSLDLGTPATDTYLYVTWDGKNDGGKKVASGVYIGVLKSGGAKKFWKMAVIK
jgi:flagellar hook assembly protein FlgD